MRKHETAIFPWPGGTEHIIQGQCCQRPALSISLHRLIDKQYDAEIRYGYGYSANPVTRYNPLVETEFDERN